MQAQLSAWPTTGARDARGPTRGRMAQGAMQLGQTALLIHGADSNGSPAPTAKRGQLNPDLSRWLMGYPVEWFVRRTVEQAGAEVQEEHWYNRCGALHGLGNAIVPQLAAVFIRCAEEARRALK